jgi:hypothetical protein
LACELPLRFLFIVHAALYRLVNGQARGGSDVELATPGNVKLRHAVCHRHNQLRTNTIIETVIGIFGLPIGPTPSRTAQAFTQFLIELRGFVYMAPTIPSWQP